METSAELLDAMTEMINIGVGRAAGMLNEMLNSHVTLQVPYVKIFSPSKLKEELQGMAISKLSVIRLGFKGSFSGTAYLAFPAESASNLVGILTSEEEENPDLDSIRVGALTEVGNIVLSGVMGSISNVLKQRLRYTIPIYLEDSIESLVNEGGDKGSPEPTIVLARTQFKLEKLKVQGDIILLFRVGFFDTLVKTLNEMEAGE